MTTTSDIYTSVLPEVARAAAEAAAALVPRAVVLSSAGSEWPISSHTRPNSTKGDLPTGRTPSSAKGCRRAVRYLNPEPADKECAGPAVALYHGWFAVLLCADSSCLLRLGVGLCRTLTPVAAGRASP
jgi:hypothetical protein